MTWADMPHHYKGLTLATLAMMGITMMLAVASPIIYVNVSKTAGFAILSAAIFLLGITVFLTVLSAAGIFHHHQKVHKKK